MKTMDPAEEVLRKALSRQNAMNAVIDRGDSAVQQFYRGATVFVTGGSGFLGKQLIEKLLRSCEIRVLYVLLRPRKGQIVKNRVDYILADPIFNNLRKKRPDVFNLIVPIEGNVADVHCGIADNDRGILIKKVNVIFHMAATVAFNDPLKIATLTNIRGTRDIVMLAKTCMNLRSFVYVSTAYSHATFSRRDTELMERFYPSPMDPHLMIELAEHMSVQKLNDIRDGLIQGWPNTYSFTKALAEELVRVHGQGLPTIVIRPTVVICTNREPEPGWIDSSNLFGPSGYMLGSTMGYVHTKLSMNNVKIDFVPSDYVCNASIVAPVVGKKTIYQIGTSCRNPIYWNQLARVLREVVAKKYISPQAVWYCFVIETPFKLVYMILSYLLHYLPALCVHTYHFISGTKPRFALDYSIIEKMSTIFHFYTNTNWIFNDNNTKELYNSLSEDDKAIYHCDVADVEWSDQIVLWCVGLRKYIVKDGLRGTEWAMRKQLVYKIVTYVLSGLFIFNMMWLLCYLYFFIKYIFG